MILVDVYIVAEMQILMSLKMVIVVVSGKVCGGMCLYKISNDWDEPMLSKQSL